MTYKPKFLSKKNFKTFVAVVDTFIQTNGDDAITAVDVAQRMDTLFDRVDNPQLDQMSQLFTVMNIYSFFTRGTRFFKLNLDHRKKVINDFQNPGKFIKCVDRLPITQGLSRDLIKGLKVLCSMGYYSSVASMKQVGFIPFDDRASTIGKDQTPLTHNLPLA